MATTTLAMSSVSIHVTDPNNNVRPAPPQRARSASLLHKHVISRMRPLPFQYVFAMWHTKVLPSPPVSASASASSSTAQPLSSSRYSLTCLSDNIPDIAAFYRIYNNFPWSSIRTRDSVHFFRAGVKPLWEDEQNVNGGCWTIKARKEGDKALRTWEELSLMVLGGELGSELTFERDHILGISFSPRLYVVHISIWTKLGSNSKSVEILTSTIKSRLSEDLRPVSSSDYYFKKHSDHEGWKEVVEAAGVQEPVVEEPISS